MLTLKTWLHTSLASSNKRQLLLNKSPSGLNAIGAFLLPPIFLYLTFYASSGGTQASPFLTRDQNPLTLVYGQPMPTDAWLPDQGQFNYAISLDLANTVNSEDGTSDSLFIDYESYHLTLGGTYGLNDNWAIKLDLPFMYRSGGTFDHAIDEWHKFFGLPRGIRPSVPEDQFSVVYTRNGTTQLDMTASQSGLTDSQLAIGRRLYQTSENALSLWASVDIPLGDSNQLTGNEDVDFAVMLAGASKLVTLFSVDANFGAVIPGDSVIPGLETESLVWFGHAGGQFGFNETFALKLQLAGHGSYYQNTDIEFLGDALIIIFGGSVNTGKCSALDVGVSEDIDPGTSPDFSLLISWKSQLGEC